MDKPSKWTEVYPHGTKEGDEESRFFRALARHPKYDWRSTGAIIKSSKLSQERVEEIIDKYINMSPPLIFSHPSNESHWGYWERVPDMLKDDNRDLCTKDKDSRIGKHLGANVTFLADEDDIYFPDDYDLGNVATEIVADVEYFKQKITQSMNFSKKFRNDDRPTLQQAEPWFSPNGPNRGDVPKATEIFHEEKDRFNDSKQEIKIEVPEPPEIPDFDINVEIPEPTVQFPPIFFPGIKFE